MRFIILITLIWPTSLIADPAINTTYKYYLINTKTSAQLMSDLNHASPIKENGEIFHGHTDSNIRWKFSWQSKHGKCRISKVNTYVDITYTLPKRIHKTTDRDLQKIWDEWFPALLAHEKNHATHAINTATKIEQTIKNLTPYSNCKDLELAANKKGNILIKALNKLDKEYDKKTDHGQTEGAKLTSYF